MTYNELKKIAKPYIRENAKLPTNSFLILTQMGIPFKNEVQCEEDYGGRMTPLYKVPAFLAIKNNVKTMYFSSKTHYWNFYIFHEIAHYLLDHEGDSPQNEIDADMLACILVAPIENLPTYLKSARDLSTLCKIPIDKAEMYWQEISIDFPNSHKKLCIAGIILLILFTIIGLSIKFNRASVSIPENIKNASNVLNQTIMEETHKSPTNNVPFEKSTYYMTSAGTHYHKADCHHVKHKTNIISITLDEAYKLNLESCKECIN